MTGQDLARFARTAAHLHPAQIGQRTRLRTQRVALQRWPQLSTWLLAGPDPAAAAGWPRLFRPLDAQAWRDWPGGLALRAGRMELLGTSLTMTGQGAAERPGWEHADWELPGQPLLWRFHLHYWDWAWALASEPDRARARTFFATLWRSWQAAVPAGRGVPWYPYPAALRAWSWCALYRDLVAGSEIDGEFVRSLAAHAGFLRRHLETDLGGNHLIKDLKALFGLAVFFADAGLLQQAGRRLMRQLAVQILPDGGHYERAPAYHCQVLGDLIDVDGLLRASGRQPAPELSQAILRMRHWLGVVLGPGGGVPMLNDGFPVSPDLLAALRPQAAPDQPLHVLPDTGLVWARAGDWQLLADVGLPCPDELPGHAHADTLSFLLHVDRQPLLVDTGTSTYAAGPVRNYERSTAAHNTAQLDGADSTEVWGAFRAARRARVHDAIAHADAAGVIIEAAHDGYRVLPGHPRHRRRWSLTERGLTVEDLVTGGGRHRVVVRWHLAPGTALRLQSGSAVATAPAGEFAVTVTASAAHRLDTEVGQLATGFGHTVTAPVLTCELNAALPVRICTSWRRASDTQGDT